MQKLGYGNENYIEQVLTGDKCCKMESAKWKSFGLKLQPSLNNPH